jgi:DNA polymerase-3 subunit delta'
MKSHLAEVAPEMTATHRQKIIAVAAGSAGRAMAFAELDLAPLEEKALSILREGDPTNARRSELAQELGKKKASGLP